MGYNRLAALLFLLASAPYAGAAWTTRNADDTAALPIAYNTNDTGQNAELFTDVNNVVYMRLRLNSGFEAFAGTSCPTFQIDKRRPMYHFALGTDCEINAKDVTIALGQIIGTEIKSQIIHQLMYGREVTFRYTLSNGQYRQTVFSLASSMQALMQAIGSDVRVTTD